MRDVAPWVLSVLIFGGLVIISLVSYDLGYGSGFSEGHERGHIAGYAEGWNARNNQ